MMPGEASKITVNGGQMKNWGGSALSFLDHDFVGDKINKWYQWEGGVQMAVRGVNAPNAKNEVGENQNVNFETTRDT
eukprot:7124078-Ditylum_brightwellii.AAC.1